MDDTEPGTAAPEEQTPGGLGEPPRRRVVPLRLAPEAEDAPPREYVSPWPGAGPAAEPQWRRRDEEAPSPQTAAAPVDDLAAPPEPRLPESEAPDVEPSDLEPELPAEEARDALESASLEAAGPAGAVDWWSTTGDPLPEQPAVEVEE